jgi:hypothetical protein
MKNRNLSGNIFNKQSLTIKETTLSALIKQFMDAHKIYNDRLNSGKVQIIKKYYCKKINAWKEFRNWLYLCSEGTPDRFAIVGGHIIFIEVKQKGKKPSPEQLAKHEELRKAGAVVLVVDSFEDFREKLDKIRREITG